VRSAPFRKADVDDIEVSRHDGLGEDLPRLPGDLGPEVAVREVREHEHFHARFARDLRRLGRGRMAGLLCPFLLLGGEGPVVDEHVGVGRDLEDRPARPGVAGEDDAPAGPRRPDDVRGLDTPAVIEDDCFAMLERAEERPFRNRERAGSLEVEPPRPRSFDEGVAVRRDPVAHAEDAYRVAVPLERLAGADLDQGERVGQTAEDALERGEELLEPGGSVNRERQLAAAQRKRLQHPRQAEVVVRVVVGEEDLGQLDEPDGGAKQLSLRAFATVEKQPFSTAPHERGGRAPARRRDRAGGPEEDEIEVHGASVRPLRSPEGRGFRPV